MPVFLHFFLFPWYKTPRLMYFYGPVLESQVWSLKKVYWPRQTKKDRNNEGILVKSRDRSKAASYAWFSLSLVVSINRNRLAATSEDPSRAVRLHIDALLAF
jgi:hypothetical protein